jgi:hypothetical protein
MAEYECHSFWVADGGTRDNVEPASLGLPQDLASEIDSWEETYEATYVPEDPAASGFPNQDAERAFNVQGRKLATRTAGVLGHGWTVQYYDTLAKELVPV